MFMMNKEVRPSVETVNLLERVNSKIKKNRCFTVSVLAIEFPETSPSTVYTILTEKLNYWKFYTR